MEIVSTSPEACLHCGDPPLRGSSFCCRGCESVYTLLHSRGLGHFYELRDQLSFAKPQKAASVPEQEEPAGPRARFYIEGIHCLGCLWLLEKLPEIDGRIRSAQLDLSHNTLEVEASEKISWQEIRAMIAELGYTARALESESAIDLKKDDQRRQLLRLGVAAFSSGNVMLLAVALYAGAAEHWAPLFRWLSALLAAPALLWSAWPLYRAALLPLLRGRLSVDLAIALALLAGITLSTRSLLLGSNEIYFDSLSMLVFLLLSSRYLLSRYRESLAQEAPFLSFLASERYARNHPEAGIVTAKELKAGDAILLRAGQTLPADSRLLSNDAHFDFSLLTGESRPMRILQQESVDGGAKLVSESARFEVIRGAGESRLAQILQQIHSFRVSRSPALDFAERMGKYFVVVVLSLAALTLFLLPDEEGMRRALAFVIVTCPCVLAFAVPLAFSRAMQKAASLGVLFRNPEKIEALAEARKIFLDKTGTLSLGEYRVNRWITLVGAEQDTFAVAASLEQHSRHPVARAILRFTDGAAKLPVEDVREIPGSGIIGQVAGRNWQIFRATEDAAAGENEVHLLCEGVIQAKIFLGDQLRPDAPGVVRALKSLRLDPVLLSGDTEANVDQAARVLGIDEWFSRLLPEHKAQIVKSTPGAVMVGDGANDAVAFQAAAVGIAVQGAVDLSLKNSDLVLTGQGIKGLPQAIRLARSTLRLVRTNFAITLTYNVIAGSLALLGFMSPLLAAVIMPASALSVFTFTEWRMRGGGR